MNDTTTNDEARPAGGERATNGRGARAAAKAGITAVVIASFLFGAQPALPPATPTARCTALTN